MTIEAWLAKRAQLNHYWLQNEYMTFLFARRRDLDVGGAVPQRLVQRLAEWSTHKNEMEALLGEAEDALSPRQLFNQPPLDMLLELHRDWLMPLTHELYCERSGIRKAVADIGAKIIEVDELVTRIGSNVAEKETGTKLYDRCRVLSSLITALPSEIQLK